jgi:hypothetical protein
VRVYAHVIAHGITYIYAHVSAYFAALGIAHGIAYTGAGAYISAYDVVAHGITYVSALGIAYVSFISAHFIAHCVSFIGAHFIAHCVAVDRTPQSRKCFCAKSDTVCSVGDAWLGPSRQHCLIQRQYH